MIKSQYAFPTNCFQQKNRQSRNPLEDVTPSKQGFVGNAGFWSVFANAQWQVQGHGDTGLGAKDSGACMPAVSQSPCPTATSQSHWKGKGCSTCDSD